MWNDINDCNDLVNFMDEMLSFHDSCVKEMRYLSGAYVDDDLSMSPINSRRILRVVIQRQYEDNSMVEMEFQGLKYLKLFPIGEGYTCEIIDSTMVIKDGCIYWCDRGDFIESDFKDYTGTIICASKLRWRSIKDCMGETDFYCSRK